MMSYQNVLAKNVAYSPSYVPTAVFVGGTSGIGQAMAQALADVTKGRCNIILIGRNRAAAEKILASFAGPPSPSASGGGGGDSGEGNGTAKPVHEFIQCDAFLMKNVHAAAAALRERFTKINYLVLSTGFIRFSGRRETAEGLDEKLALLYYARWTFIHDLVPLLNRARDAGEDAKVMSVLSAAQVIGIQANLDDLGMVKNYTGMSSMRVAPTYNDLMCEKFLSLNPSITFIHIYPGPVLTPLYLSKVFPWNILGWIQYFMLWPIAISAQKCAQYMWFALHSYDSGFHRCVEHGQDVGKRNYRGSDEAREALWSHTLEVTKSKQD